MWMYYANLMGFRRAHTKATISPFDSLNAFETLSKVQACPLYWKLCTGIELSPHLCQPI